MPPGNQGRQRPPRRPRLCFQLTKRLRTGLARGAPPRAGGDAGAGPEVAERWEQRCETTVLTAGREGVGGALEVSCLGSTGAGSEAEQVRRDVRRVMGVTQPGRLSSERRKLLVSAGCLRFQDGEEPWVAGAPFPRKLSSPAQRWVADCSWSQPSARLSSQLSLLDRGVVSSLSACLRQACFRHSKGTGGPPLPRGAQGGFNGAAGQAWGHAQQCSTLLHSTVVGRPG